MVVVVAVVVVSSSRSKAITVCRKGMALQGVVGWTGQLHHLFPKIYDLEDGVDRHSSWRGRIIELIAVRVLCRIDRFQATVLCETSRL